MTDLKVPDAEFEREIRAMLRGRVADVHPRIDPVAIRATAGGPNHRRYLPLAAAAVVPLVVLSIWLVIGRDPGRSPIQPAAPSPAVTSSHTAPHPHRSPVATTGTSVATPPAQAVTTLPSATSITTASSSPTPTLPRVSARTASR